MNLSDSITNAVMSLTSDSTFSVSQLVIDEKNFGNIITTLKSTYEIDVRFIKDKGDYWSEIGHLNEWYFLEDVFFAIGIRAIPSGTDFVEMIANSSTSIKDNLPLIIKSFDDKNSKETQAKIKAIATKRVMNMFNLDSAIHCKW
jgi:hypothetical protein